MKSPPRLSPTLGGITAAVFCCAALFSGAASAQVAWERVGTVTTLTSGQLCKNDGKNMICDSTTPSISASNFVGLGSTAPVVSLDDSQFTDAIALPGGSNAQRPTGAALVNGEIRYNTSGSGQVEAYYNGAWNSLVTSATAGTSTPAAGSTGQVQFNNGGYLGASSNFYWDNTNARLGIGPTSPQQALSVSGNANVTGYVGIGIGTATAITPLQVGQSPAGVAPSLSADNGIATFRTSTTPELQIGGYPTSPFAMWMQVKRASNDGTSWPLAIQPLGGNVGIGTTGPLTTLDVRPDSSFAATEAIQLAQTSDNPSLRLFRTNGGAAAYPWYIRAGGAAISNLEFATGTTSAIGSETVSTVFTIANSGNVGIGSTVPVASLDLSQKNDALALPGGSNAQRPTGTSLVNGEIRYNTAGTGQVEAYYNGAWNSLVTSATLGTSTPAAGSTGQVQFNSGGFLGASSNFTWDNTNSRLGIGTTSPVYPLNVVGNGRFQNTGGTEYLDILTTDSNNPYLRFVAGNISRFVLGVDASDSAKLKIGTANDFTTTLFTMTSGGNVGIGTTSPSDTMDVNGSLTLEGTNPHIAVRGGDTNAQLNIDFPQNTTTNTTLRLFRSTITSGGTAGFTIYKPDGTGANPNAFLNANAGTTYINALGGNVGIGTTVPSVPLSFGQSLSPVKVAVWDNGTLLYGMGVNSGQLTFGAQITSGGTPQMVLTNTGNVGIGTTTPQNLLDVNGAASIGYNVAAPSNGLIVSGNVGIGTTVAGSALTVSGYADVGNPALSSVVRTSDSGSAGFIQSYVSGSAGTLVFNAAGGNVGIGTTAPTAPLTVQGSSGANAILVQDNASIYGGMLSFLNSNASSTLGLSIFQGGSNASADSWINNAAVIEAQTSGGLDISAYNNNGIFFQTGVRNTVMVINSSGNVGIGTTAPDAILSLGGGAARTIDMVRNPTANTAGNGLTVQSGGATSAATDKVGGDLTLSSGIATGTGSSNIQFKTATAQGSTNTTDNTPTTKMTITGAGSVGIGTTSPATGVTADINGPVKVAGSGSEPCTAAQVGAIRYNPTGQYFELCSYP